MNGQALHMPIFHHSRGWVNYGFEASLEYPVRPCPSSFRKINLKVK